MGRPLAAILAVVVLTLPAVFAQAAGPDGALPVALPVDPSDVTGSGEAGFEGWLRDALAQASDPDERADLQAMWDEYLRTRWNGTSPSETAHASPDDVVSARLLPGSVELVDRRTMNGKLYQVDGNGTFLARLAAGPLHYLDAAGSWQDIDTTIVHAGLGYANLANTFPTSFGLDGTVRMGGGEGWIQWTPVGAGLDRPEGGPAPYLPVEVATEEIVPPQGLMETGGAALPPFAPGVDVGAAAAEVVSASPGSPGPVAVRVDGDRIEYRGLLGDVLDRYTVHRGVVKRDAVLEERPEVGSGPWAMPWYVVSGRFAMAEGLTLWNDEGPVVADFATDGALAVTGASGDLLFIMPPVVAKDSGEGEHQKSIAGKYRGRFVEGRLYLEMLVPIEALLDAALQYPVAIDPTVVDKVYAILHKETSILDLTGTKRTLARVAIGAVNGQIELKVGSHTMLECLKVWKWFREPWGERKVWYTPWEWRWETIYEDVKRLVTECLDVPDDHRTYANVPIGSLLDDADRVTDVSHHVYITGHENRGTLYLKPVLPSLPSIPNAHYNDMWPLDSRSATTYVQRVGWHEMKPSPEVIEAVTGAWVPSPLSPDTPIPDGLEYGYDGGSRLGRGVALKFEVAPRFPEWIVTFEADDNGPETQVSPEGFAEYRLWHHPDRGTNLPTAWAKAPYRVTLRGVDDGTKCRDATVIRNDRATPFTVAFPTKTAPVYFDPDATHYTSRDCEVRFVMDTQGAHHVGVRFVDLEGRTSEVAWHGGVDWDPPTFTSVVWEGVPAPTPGYFSDWAEGTFTFADTGSGCFAAYYRTQDNVRPAPIAGSQAQYLDGNCVLTLRLNHKAGHVWVSVIDRAGNPAEVNMPVPAASSSGPKQSLFAAGFYKPNADRGFTGANRPVPIGYTEENDVWSTRPHQNSAKVGFGTPYCPWTWGTNWCAIEYRHSCIGQAGYLRINDGAEFAPQSTCNAATISTDGAHRLRVRSVNSGGFESNYDWILRVDRNKPGLRIIPVVDVWDGTQPEVAPGGFSITNATFLRFESYDTASAVTTMGGSYWHPGEQSSRPIVAQRPPLADRATGDFAFANVQLPAEGGYRFIVEVRDDVYCVTWQCDVEHSARFDKTVVVDRVPPTVRLTLDGAIPSGQTFSRTPVVVEDFADVTTYVTKVEHRVNGGPWSLGGLPSAFLNHTGAYEVVYRVADAAGNVGLHTFSFRLDLEAPMLHLDTDIPMDPAARPGSGHTPGTYQAFSGWTSSPITATLTCVDDLEGSGCVRSEHRGRSPAWQNTAQIDLPDPGFHLLQLEGVDAVGHVRRNHTYALGYDAEAPAVSLRGPCLGASAWCGEGSVSVDVTIDDAPASVGTHTGTVFSADFEEGVAPNWTSAMPLGRHKDVTGNHWLGPFRSGGVELFLPYQRMHDLVVLEFDLLVSGSWNGVSTNHGPDTFRIDIVDGKPNYVTSIGTRDPQCYPATHPCALASPALTGALKVDGHFGQTGAATDPSLYPDAVYHVVHPMLHTGRNLTLSLSASVDGGPGEVWAIDNVRVSTENSGVDAGSIECDLDGAGHSCFVRRRLDQGAHVFSARGSDVAGNVGGARAVVGVDRMAPAADPAFDCVVPGFVGWCKSQDIRIFGDAEDQAPPAGTPVVGTPRPVFHDDLKDGAAAGWDPAKAARLRTTFTDLPFLGPYGRETVPLQLTGLPPHEALVVEFDLLLLESWDGVEDQFEVRIDGQQAFRSSFSNFAAKQQCFPAQAPCTTTVPGLTGSHTFHQLFKVDTRNDRDSAYRLRAPIEHNGTTARIDFTSFQNNGNMADEAWGLANVRVYTDMAGVSSGGLSCAVNGLEEDCITTRPVTDGTHALRVTARDAAGQEVSQEAPIKVDSVPPVATLTPPAVNAHGWSNGPRTASVVCTDATSGCAGTFIGLDGGPLEQRTAASFDRDGIHPFRYETRDVAGHASAVKTHEARIDRITPEAGFRAACPTPGADGWCRADAVPVEARVADRADNDAATDVHLVADRDLEDGSTAGWWPGHFKVRSGPLGSNVARVLPNWDMRFYFADVPKHEALTVEFDLWVRGDWNGVPSYGQGLFLIGVTNGGSFATTFANLPGTTQCFPLAHPCTAPSPAGTGAVGIAPVDGVGTGGTQPRLYHVVATLPHTASSGHLYWARATSTHGLDVDNLRIVAESSGIDAATMDCRLNGVATWCTQKGPWPQGQNTLSINASDRAGHPTSNETTLLIDSIAPTLAVERAGTRGEAGWWLSQVAIDLACADPAPGSGCRATAWRPSAQSGWTESAAFDVTSDGIHGFVLQSSDIAGNQHERSEEVRIDTVPPETALETIGPRFDAAHAYVNGVTQFRLDASDATSGVAQVRYEVGTGGYEYVGPFRPQVADGAFRLAYQSRDVAGLWEDLHETSFYMDTVGPTSQIALGGPVVVVDDHHVVAPNAVASTDATDEGSGVRDVFMRLDDAEPVGNTSMVLPAATGVHRLAAWAVDNLDQAGDVATLDVVVDADAPQTMLAVAGAQVTIVKENETQLYVKGDSGLLLPAVDTGADPWVAGVQSTYWRFAGEPAWTLLVETVPTPEASGRYDIEFYSVDAVGNTEEVRSARFWVDLEAPDAGFAAPKPGEVWTPGGPVRTDTDGDGLPDALEEHLGTDPRQPDLPLLAFPVSRTYVLPGTREAGADMPVITWSPDRGGVEPVGLGYTTVYVDDVLLAWNFTGGDVSAQWPEWADSPGTHRLTVFATDWLGNAARFDHEVEVLGA